MSNDFLAQTTLKILINDWSKLREIILLITKRQSEAPNPITQSDLSLALVSDEAIRDVFEGPFHALLRPLCEGYALISKLRTYTVINQDEAIKPQVYQQNLNIPPAINKTVTAAQLDKLQRELDEVAHQHFQDWQFAIKAWQAELLEKFSDFGASLSEREAAEWHACEPLFVLKQSYLQQNLTLPKTKAGPWHMSDYLRAKMLYSLHAALGRQLTPHTQADLEKRLKTYKAIFKQIEQNELALVQQVQQNTERVIRQLT